MVLTDRRQHVLPYFSQHSEPIDPSRIRSILAGQVSAEIMDWVARFKPWDARAPVAIPAIHEHGMGDRIVVPMRARGMLVGMLWISAKLEELTPEQVAVSQQAAEAAAVIVYRHAMLQDGEREHARVLLRDALDADPATRQRGAEGLIQDRLLSPDASYTAVVVRRGDGSLSDDDALTFEAVIDRVARDLPAVKTLRLVRGDHALLVLEFREPREASAPVARVAVKLQAAAAEELGSGCATVVGVGRAVEQVADLAQSYVQAAQSAWVGSIVAEFAPVVHYDDLGAYQVLAGLPAEARGGQLIHPGLLRLLEEDKRGALIETLERYLLLAGDAKATSDALSLHRTSLYYRLDRIQELAGVDLHSGEDRLMLHLSLKLARLSGLMAGPAGTGASEPVSDSCRNAHTADSCIWPMRADAHWLTLGSH